MGVYYKHEAAFEELAPEIPANESYVDPIQLSIEVCEIEHKLFEAVIETDFAEVYKDNGACNINESTIEYIREASVKGILDAAKALFEKVVAAIKNFFEVTLPNAIVKVVTSNAALKKAYKGKISFDAIKEKGKAGSKIKYVDQGQLKKIEAEFFSIMEDLSRVATADTFDEDEYKKVVARAEAQLAYFGKNEEGKKDTGGLVAEGTFEDMEKSGSIKGNPWSTVDLIESDFAILKKFLAKNKNGSITAVKSSYDKIKKESGNNEDQESAQAAQEKFDRLKKVIDIENKLQSMIKGLCLKVIGVSRISYIKLGLAATGKKVEEKAGEGEVEKVSGDVVDKDGNVISAKQEAFDYLLDLVNDSVVEEAFAF